MAPSTPSLGADLHALVSLVDRAGSRALGRGGEVTYRRYVVLTAIAQLGAPTQHALARHLGLSDAAVSRMLGNLVATGLVATAVDPGHRRRHSVRLTPLGVELEQRLGARLDAAMSAMLAAVGLDERAFGAEVARLRAGFGAWLEGPGAADGPGLMDDPAPDDTDADGPRRADDPDEAAADGTGRAADPDEAP